MTYRNPAEEPCPSCESLGQPQAHLHYYNEDGKKESRTVCRACAPHGVTIYVQNRFVNAEGREVQRYLSELIWPIDWASIAGEPGSYRLRYEAWEEELAIWELMPWWKRWLFPKPLPPSQD